MSEIPYDWARVECPTCGAQPDTRCRAKSGRVTDAHSRRLYEGWRYSRQRGFMSVDVWCPDCRMSWRHGCEECAEDKKVRHLERTGHTVELRPYADLPERYFRRPRAKPPAWMRREDTA